MAKLPGETPKIFRPRIIEEHITATIQMMAVGCNPYSVHVLAKACSAIVHNLADHRGVVLEGDFRDLIKPEHLGDYIRVANKAYNFLKHADRDPGAPYDGPPHHKLVAVNEFLTLHNIHGYRKLEGTAPAPFIDFTVLMMMRHPQYLKPDAFQEYPEIAAQIKALKPDNEIVGAALRARLREHGLWPTAEIGD